MAEITTRTSFQQRARASLREELLDAATELLADHGYAGLRMADVAARVGVSRQTVYNEFGGKAALVQAVSLRTAAEFLDGVHQRLDDASDLVEGIRAAVRYTVEHARENRLVAAVLGTEAGADLLPLLTTRGEPILRAASEQAATRYRARLPVLDRKTADLLAETVVRLTLSHLLLRTHTAAEAADAVCAVIGPAIVHFASTPDSEVRGTEPTGEARR
ncbi:DNA-binding transcriptional regulator, AcrR family [Amycolatopsis arida]|uniref:DNA-binding transcriptional regulator, AcrR family n=1 Tax=Amycolatopsis arida TaxID=587909 RepID=A0A1I5QLS3_9PSEU|nr:TetR family transcriptional regulator [Amycolatopsis arida]TDX98885.1 AcrR family transcriptional regulator [Amycolatopsis arida]SFP46981.1 DNA-binding transcriptional regulator, AcrR family [Amycolatopsis arida]